MSKLVKVDVDFSVLENLGSFIDRHGDRISMAMAAVVQTNRGLLFDRSGAYNGHEGWKKPAFRDGKPLLDTGALRNSIGPKGANGSLVPVNPARGYIRYSGYEVRNVEVGTEIKYAKIHTTGGKITAKNGEALKIPVSGKGSKFTEKRIRKLHSELEKEVTPQRRASLQARIDEAQSIMHEASETSNYKKKRRYLRKLDDRIRSLTRNDRRLVRQLANRYHRTSEGSGKFIFRKSVFVPKRDWSEWNNQDQNELEETLVNFIEHLLEVELGG